MNFIERLRTDAFGPTESSATVAATAAGVEGWLDHKFPEVFQKALEDIGDNARPVVTILEVGLVGTWKGKSACCMASIAKSLGIPVRIIRCQRAEFRSGHRYRLFYAICGQDGLVQSSR